MNWNKLKPWNGFKKEQDGDAAGLPVRRAQQAEHPLARLHEEMDRLFEPFFRSWGLPSMMGPSSAGGRELLRSGFLRPNVDISESKKGYTIRAEIPGVDKDALRLMVEDDTLIISGEKQQEKADDEGGYHCVERSYGAFRRMISLPADADQEKLEAKFRNGVLTVRLPRLPGVKSQTREVTIG